MVLRENACIEGVHSPSKYKNPIIRFLHFLFLKHKLYYRKDDTALCAKCNVFLRTPLAYYHWGAKMAYVLAGMLVITFIIIFPKSDYGDYFVRYGIIGVSLFATNRIIDSFIFAFFPWRLLDETNIDPQALIERANNEQKSRCHMVYVGMFIGFLINISVLFIHS